MRGVWIDVIFESLPELFAWPPWSAPPRCDSGVVLAVEGQFYSAFVATLHLVLGEAGHGSHYLIGALERVLIPAVRAEPRMQVYGDRDEAFHRQRIRERPLPIVHPRSMLHDHDKRCFGITLRILDPGVQLNVAHGNVAKFLLQTGMQKRRVRGKHAGR